MKTPKAKKYLAERKFILAKIQNIIEFKDNQFYLFTVQNDINKQNQIIEMIPEIKQYYDYSNIRGITKQSTTKSPWLSIIKYVLKEFYEIDIIQSSLKIKDRNGKIKYQKTQKYSCRPRPGPKIIFMPIGKGKFEVITKD